MSAVTDRINPYTMSDHEPSVRARRILFDRGEPAFIFVELIDADGRSVGLKLTEGQALALAYELNRTRVPARYPEALV